MIEQRTNEWHEQRRGKFTSSKAGDIMGIKGLGKTGESYAFEKAIEILEGVDQDELDTFDIRRGVELEPLAFKCFNAVKSLDFIEAVETGFIELNENIGSSPDGLVGNDAILEIKCPRRNKFFKVVAFGSDEVDKDYIYQVQHQMWVTGRKLAYLMFYIIDAGEERYHIIEIPRCDITIAKLKSRTEEVIKLRNEYLTLLTNNKQY